MASDASIAPLRKLKPWTARDMLSARPGDLTPVDGHRDHIVVEWLYEGGIEGMRIWLKCSCGRKLGGGIG